MKDNIVYIIGAGASKEAGLPTGKELQYLICNALDFRFGTYGTTEKGDDKIIEAIREHASADRKVKIYLQASSIIKKGIHLTKSIDTFIDNHRDDETIAFCGKLAIVRTILKKEAESSLHSFSRKYENNSSYLDDTWLISFFKNISEGCNKKEIKNRLKSIKLIIFNYDRCIEQFLFHAISNLYEIDTKETLEILNELKIFHPYGSIGNPFPTKEEGIIYGANPVPSKLLELSKNIKTFTEGTSALESDINEIKIVMKNAKKVIFLGFAFHQLNMEILKPAYNERKYPEFYATTYGFSDHDRELIKYKIRDLYHNDRISHFPPTIHTTDKTKTCYDFFNEFQIALSF